MSSTVFKHVYVMSSTLGSRATCTCKTRRVSSLEPARRSTPSMTSTKGRPCRRRYSFAASLNASAAFVRDSSFFSPPEGNSPELNSNSDS
jgi:hypothetical protein